MTQHSHLIALKGMDVLDFYRQERAPLVLDTRVLGLVGMLEIRQPAGSYPDPASDNYVMLVPLNTDCEVRFDFGAGAIRQRFVGELSLATPGTICDYDLDDSHHVIGLSIPAAPLANLLEEVDPRFPGHFGTLHSTLWRSTEIRDHALRIWRAGKGDPAAPALDPDAAFLKLALLLLARAGRGISPVKDRYRLSPFQRRRVVEFIEANLDGDLSLFRLAAVAGLSPYHFARSFRHDMGDTPHRFVLARRIDRARRLLCETSIPLVQIALACGFGSQPHLNEVFRRELGLTPAAMRVAARS
jgi:AraC family transcriptional regulator